MTAASERAKEDVKKAINERLLTSKEVTEMLEITATTLWNWERASVLVPIKHGRKKLYKLSEVLNRAENPPTYGSLSNRIK